MGDVAHVTHFQRFAQSTPSSKLYGVERRDAAILRAEARAGLIRGRDIEGHAHESDIIFNYLANVFQVRRLQERVDAGPVRQPTALEAADRGLVLDRIDALEAELLAAPDLLFPLRGRKRGFVLERFHTLQPGEIRQGALVLAVVGSVSVIKSHVD